MPPLLLACSLRGPWSSPSYHKPAHRRRASIARPSLNRTWRPLIPLTSHSTHLSCATYRFGNAESPAEIFFQGGTNMPSHFARFFCGRVYQLRGGVGSLCFAGLRLVRQWETVRRCGSVRIWGLVCWGSRLKDGEGRTYSLLPFLRPYESKRDPIGW